MRTSHAIYCSGQLPADADGNLVEGTMADKTRACINALSAVLDAGNSALERIIKVQIFLTDMADFPEMNAEYEKLITHKPARSCVAVKELPRGVNIEIECIALNGQPKKSGTRRLNLTAENMSELPDSEPSSS